MTAATASAAASAVIVVQASPELATDVLHAVLAGLQVGIGLVILLSSYLLSAAAVSQATRRLVRWPLVGMGAWATWFLLQPFAGAHDSPPALAFAALVAYVLTVHRRRVVAFIEGRA